jgi:uncharacterized protein (TIGR03437 family)
VTLPAVSLSVRIPLFISLLAVWLAVCAQAQVNILASNYDDSRTNSNPRETRLTPANVNKDTFGKIASFPVDGQIYAQPLYVSGVQIQGAGARDVLYVATMHNSVYAIDAGAPQSTTPLWQVNLGPTVPTSVFEKFTEILPELGILSTPVIDLDRQALYCVTDSLESGKIVFRVHALSLADGHEMFFGPTVIAASVPGLADGKATVDFDASQVIQRASLALANGTVYIGFGSHRDLGNWYGWLLGYDASDLRRLVAKLNANPNGYGASIWQSGRAPAVDANGNLYVATANGEYDGTVNFGESFLKLSTPGLNILDWYTPDDWSNLNDRDDDLGSSGLILVPGTNLMVGAGKSGEAHIADKNSMGHVSATQKVRVSNAALFSMALWNSSDGPVLYLLELYGPLRAFRIANAKLSAAPFSETHQTVDTRYAGIAISSNGTSNSSAIVWQTVGDINSFQTPGTMHAFAATDLSNELWNSDQSGDRDKLGRFAKFVPPTVVNGRVYVPTFSNQLVTYGLLSDAAPGGGPPQITALVNGASFAEGAIAPGEIVAAFGANLGSRDLFNLQLDSTGHVMTSLEGTQVLFGGVAAPLLYTSGGQVGAVVPFGVKQPAVDVQIQYQGRMSAAVSVPVTSASPALFALDGSGGGEGAILNADGTLNNDVPAERGSIVVMYGTGFGQTIPPGEDGRVAGDLPLPAPVLKTSVTIDGQPAEVLYAGAAPLLVQGVIQLNVRVPNNVSSGPVAVVVKVGDFTSPSTVQVNVR